jgi:hypothetical protein
VATTNKQCTKAAARTSQEGRDGGVDILGPIAADTGHGRGGAVVAQGQALHHAGRRSLHGRSKPSLVNSNIISLNPAPVFGFGLKLRHMQLFPD